MTTRKFAAFIAVLSIVGAWNNSRAQDEPIPDPPAPGQAPLSEPLHRKSTTEAWAALRAGENGLAIAKASECIDRYQPAADKIQTILEGDKADLPAGAVSAADRQRIDRYQILHDVAACLLIKGWAEERWGQKSEARKTYAKAKKYTYARATERPGDPLWSPAELASQGLARSSSK